ncbi:MAG: cytidylate kinase-like family protein [Bacteroidales bacterium]|nr:cytidylate kinase-like family protein [Bacteroidales bacterium]
MRNEYFRKYFLERSFDNVNKFKSHGPLITIARDFGCYSSQIADLLASRLNQESKTDNKWLWLSNEILTEAAQSLEVEPAKIAHIFGAEERPFIQEIIESLSTKKYVCDENIKKTIVRIVQKYAEQGNVIIVGRASSAITQHIKQAIHVKFIAPVDWRVKQIQQRFDLSDIEARKKLQAVDERRRVFMSYYGGDKHDSDLYDVVFNRSRMSEEEIVESIISLSKMKKLI